MRPRRFCRGKQYRSRPSRITRHVGFNEAPAILPGKAGGHVQARRAPIRFNEAPAILPGKARAGGRMPTRGSVWLQ